MSAAEGDLELIRSQYALLERLNHWATHYQEFVRQSPGLHAARNGCWSHKTFLIWSNSAACSMTSSITPNNSDSPPPRTDTPKDRT